MNKKLKIMLCTAAFLLLVINTAALIFTRHPSVPQMDPAPQVSTGDHGAAISGLDTVTSGGDVSPTDMPKIDEHIPSSLAGTQAAEHIDAIAEKYECHSMAVAVIKDGKVTYNYEYGYADSKKKTPVDSRTKYRIASLSKVVTGMMGMKLAEDGQVDMSADVGDIMGFRIRNRYFTNTPITLHMLLTHSSSFRDRSGVIFSGNLQKDLKESKSHIMREPGTGFEYTNLGMGIAGAVIEKSAGKTLTEYSREIFFDPMGIDAAFNGGLLEEKNVAECMLGLKLSRSLKQLTEPSADLEPGKNYSAGAGGLMISAVDYAKLMTILINDGTFNGERYLAPETVSAMHEVQLEGNHYEQCIAIRRSPDIIEGRTMYFHTGSAYGIYSLVAYDPQDGSGVVIISSGARDLTNDMNIRLICLHTAEALYEDLLQPVK